MEPTRGRQERKEERKEERRDSNEKRTSSSTATVHRSSNLPSTTNPTASRSRGRQEQKDVNDTRTSSSTAIGHRISDLPSPTSSVGGHSRGRPEQNDDSDARSSSSIVTAYRISNLPSPISSASSRSRGRGVGTSLVKAKTPAASVPRPSKADHSPAPALTTRRSTSAPAPAHIPSPGPLLGPWEITYLSQRTYTHICKLQNRVYLHKFPGPIELERQFFEDKKWSAQELQCALEYALEIVDYYIEHYKNMLIDTTKISVAKIGLIGFSSFVDRAEAIIEEVILPEELQTMNLADVDVERIPATIALLGIVKRRMIADRNEELFWQRTDLLKEWIHSPNRLFSRVCNTPLKLSQPQFTRNNLCWAACYARERGDEQLRRYQAAWENVESLDLVDHVKQEGCATLAEVEKLHQNDEWQTGFGELSNQELLDYEWTLQDREFTLETPVGQWNIIPDSDEAKVGQQQQWQWSIAIVARTGCEIEVKYSMLQKVMGQWLNQWRCATPDGESDTRTIGQRACVIPDYSSDSDSPGSE